MDFDTKIWTTDTVETSKRFDYWVGAICECFLEVAVDSDARSDFSARLESIPIADLRINHVTGGAYHVYRTLHAINHSENNYYYLLCKKTHSCNVIQHGLEGARLLPGDLVLIDSRKRYELDFHTSVDVVSIQLPITWLDAWLPDAEKNLGQRIDGSSGWGAVLSAYARQMPNVASLTSAPLHFDHLGGLLTLVFGDGQHDAKPDNASLVSLIESCLSGRFAEPGLCAADVAEAIGVSVRTLHRALSRDGRTFTSALTQYRFEAAQRMFSSVMHKQLTIAEIGRRAGWQDASHFTRLWHASTGKTPRESRGGADTNRPVFWRESAIQALRTTLRFSPDETNPAALHGDAYHTAIALPCSVAWLPIRGSFLERLLFVKS